MSAFFPGAVATQLNLLTAINNAMVVLGANCSVGDTSLTLSDASILPASGYLTFVDTEEIIYYASITGNVLNSVTRGADGSAAASHLAGVDLEQRWNADYHNRLRTEVIAVEQYLADRFGIGSNPTVPSSKIFAVAATANQIVLGTTRTVTINAGTPATSSRTWTVPDISADATFAALEGSQTFSGTKIFSSITSITSATTHPASAGFIRLANSTDGITWRNAANSGDISLVVNGGNQLQYNGSAVIVAGTGQIVNADVNASAAIAYSKLNLATSIVNADVATSAAIARTKLAALTANRMMITDGSGFDTVASLSASSTLATDTNGIPTTTINGAGVFALAQSNICINGGMEVWQRGTSFTCQNTKAYTADRWYQSGTGTAVTGTITKETTTVDNGGASLKLAISSSTSNGSYFVATSIENYKEYLGLTITLSMRIKGTSVAGSWFAGWSDGVGNYDVAVSSGTTGFTTYTASGTVSASATGLQILIGNWFGGIGTGTIYIDSIMWVLGGQAANFSPRPYAEELNLCQRYCYVISGNASFETIIGGQCANTTSAYFTIRYPQNMRVAPTVTVNNPTHYVLWDAALNQKTLTALTASGIQSQSFQLAATVASGLSAGNASVLFSNSTDATVICDSEM